MNCKNAKRKHSESVNSKKKNYQDSKAPGKKIISKYAVNQRQVLIALSGGELVYFEMDPVSVRIQLIKSISKFANRFEIPFCF